MGRKTGCYSVEHYLKRFWTIWKQKRKRQITEGSRNEKQ